MFWRILETAAGVVIGISAVMLVILAMDYLRFLLRRNRN